MSKPKIMCVVGTRPDAIKSAPVILELKKQPSVETVVISSGQHREMLDQALGAFGITQDRDLAIMKHGQTLAEVTARALEGIDAAIEELQPQYIVAQGDTTTTFTASLAAFYRQIPFGHVEAGLRTDTVDNPFPEEFNRRASAIIARHHFAPTRWAADNLLREGRSKRDIYVTGNTGIDAVLAVAEQMPQTWFPEHKGPVLLLTTHRRENWGEPQLRIARALLKLIDSHTDALLVVSLHRNPQVRDALRSVFGTHPRIAMIEPPDYPLFVKLMQRSTLIFTDSGGVQEEAPAFGIPVLVMRETTERPEGVHAGTAKLVGTDEGEIFTQGSSLLSNKELYKKMAHAVSPYGDGLAAQRIRCVILQHLGLPSQHVAMWLEGSA